MTRRQGEVLTFIRGHLHRHGVPPSLNEIAAGVGLSHRSTVHAHVQALVRDGHLEKRPVLGASRYFPIEPGKAAA